MILRPARRKTGMWILVCAGIVALSIAIIDSGDSFAAPLGLLVAVLFGFPLLYFIVEFIHPLEWWELTPTGITSHAFGRSLTTQWSDIEEMTFWRYGRLGQRRIFLKTRSGQQREASDKMYARQVKTQQGYHVIVPASQFSMSAEEFFSMLHHYWKDEEARQRLKREA
jgi:hypothetical protein